MRFLLDTNAISGIFARPFDKAAERYAEVGEHCFTSIVVVAELRFGLAKKASARIREMIDEVEHSIGVEPWSAPADRHYGRIRAELERAGTPIGANDMLIAAHALALDATLVTANEREFRRVRGLKVENWDA